MSETIFANNPDPFSQEEGQEHHGDTAQGTSNQPLSDLGREPNDARTATALDPKDTPAAKAPEVDLQNSTKKVAFAPPEPSPGTEGRPLAPITSDESANSSHGLIDKVKTVADERAPHVVEKVKSAAQKLHLESIQTSSVSRFFNPTSARLHIRRHRDGDSLETTLSREEQLALLWRSRDQRKGRGSLAVRSFNVDDVKQSHTSPRKQGRATRVAKGIVRMFTIFPYWDMAFWSGWSYTIGSALFVIDGAFSWSILAFSYTEFKGEEKYGVPLCFFFGALFYQVGAVMAYLEAVNDGSFHGSAMRRVLEGHDKEQKEMLDEKLHDFVHHMVPHHRSKGRQSKADQAADQVDPEAGWATKEGFERPGSIYPDGKAPASRRGGVDLGGEEEEGTSSEYATWRWWPTWHALRTHHVYEIGYVATAIQLFGVTLYGITSIVILPGILDSLNWWQTDGAYWVPQIVAAACFLIASLMFMFETQEKWWKPEVKVLGWWIGFWSTVGSVGFELCAGFGPAGITVTGYEYQSSLSSTWGSAAYLIGSMLQWYEAVNKHPEQEWDEPGEMKTWQIHPL
ncbi:hypothetical protein LTR86_006632 [Recurvomyces mirabilis]|nr:hypothetical protein LTR86_006632 [Recurvomyces mirabilis]